MEVSTQALQLCWIGVAEGEKTARKILEKSMTAIAMSASGLARFLNEPQARCHVAVSGASTAQVLTLALVQAAQIETLTLISPPDITRLDAELVAKLKVLEIPTLVLFGAVMSPHPASPGTQWRRAFGKANLVYIYDAEEPLDAARPEAVASVMADFMARKDGFLIRMQDDRFHP